VTTTLAALAVHPVKSTAVRGVQHAAVDTWGLRDDRRWMVVDATGECVTAREEPRLLRVVADTSRTDAAVTCDLRLRSPEGDELSVAAPSGEPVPVTVHGRGRGLTAVPAADEASAWLRACLGRDDVTLVHVCAPRALNPGAARPGEATAFADGYPVTVATLASLRRLDDWVTQTALERGEEPVSPLAMARFRPNLVVDGGLEPFEEDHWTAVRVGSVDFRVVKPVDRCVMTTIDPETAERGPEPIRTLARHRRWDGTTWFAVQLVPEVRGELRVGDEVVPSR
jgi:uncharacterized protein YcbX